MYVINFQKQFVPAIESGTKKQTIRAIRKDNRQPKVGDALRLYTGMRTKFCRRIAEVICTKVYPIKIFENGVSFKDYDHLYGKFALKIIAESDGFGSWEEMLEYFKKNHGLPFNGILIKWEVKE